MKENKGFSLVELIIVIGMLGILLTVAIWGTGANHGWRVNKCAETVSTTLNKTMVQTMSKGNLSGMIIYKLDGTYYASMIENACYDSTLGIYQLEDDNIVQTVALGNGSIVLEMEYIGTDGTVISPVTLTDQTNRLQMTSAAQLLFNRSTGEIKKVTVGGFEAYYTGITITSGDKSKQIVIYSATGKNEIS